MTGRKMYREAVSAVVAAGVVTLALWGLPADLGVAAPSDADAIALSPALLVAPAPAAYTVDAAADDLVERPNDFGTVLVDPGLQMEGKQTSANVIAWPASGPLRPDGEVFQFDEAPLPVPDGASVVDFHLEDSTLVTTSLDGSRSVDEVLDFYQATFGPGIEAVQREDRDGSARLLLFAGDRNVGWVVARPVAGGVETTIAWHL